MVQNINFYSDFSYFKIMEDTFINLEMAGRRHNHEERLFGNGCNCTLDPF